MEEGRSTKAYEIRGLGFQSVPNVGHCSCSEFGEIPALDSKSLDTSRYHWD